MTDRTNTTCELCCKGKYVEASLMDDVMGVLHCNNCDHMVRRYWEVKEEAPSED